MTIIKKKYIKVNDKTSLEIMLSYNKDTGLSMWDYKPMKRGYSVSVSPVEIEQHDGYVTVTSFAMAGIKSFLLEVPRASTKALKEACHLANATLPAMISKVLETHSLTLPITSAEAAANVALTSN